MTHLIGTSGDDHLVTGKQADDISGGDGNDFIFAGNGDDTLDGGNGDDFLWGGQGVDTMTGGAGADTFYIDNSRETQTFKNGVWTAAPDHITDFETGVDSILIGEGQGVAGIRSVTITDSGNGHFLVDASLQTSWDTFHYYVDIVGTVAATDVVWA